eukprot:m.123265 g.123265  ORF g.123265 m.123265 type:complete len:519 (+) comp16585_c4_seq1:472-2028(+)
MAKAVALYDFTGDADQGELSFSAGQDITILRQDIGEGWWEGEVGGKTGLFPETYVELDDDDEDWDDDDDDDGWDDGPEDEEEPPSRSGSYSVAPSQSAAATSSRPMSTAYDGFDKTVTLKRSMNRFSAFVKAGAEGFMIGAVKDVTIDPRAVVHMNDTPDGPEWEPNPQPFNNIRVDKAGTRSKFKGIKSYEAYSISGATRDGSVERRFKHFIWLHERLHEKYSCLCVPPLPDKQFMSKYGETFVDKRKEKLQAWLDRISRHPVIGRDELSFHHFLTCATSDTKGWKMGKRKAEKDDFTGATFFKVLSQDVACPKNYEREIDQFANFVKEMDKAIKKSQETALAHASRMSGGFKKEFKTVAGAFSQLGQCFAQNVPTADGDSVKLSRAIVKTSIILEQIADDWGMQPKFDQLPYIDGLKEYTGILGRFGDAVQSSRHATHKVIEIEENEEAVPGEKDAVRKRADVIHTLSLCEAAHFHKSRREDFKKYMTDYLAAQISFYEGIAQKLRDAQAEFSSLP